MENSGDRSKSRQYKLKWFKDTKAFKFKYSGYESAIRIPGEIPEPPNGVKASTNDYRSFMKDGKLQVHFGPTHYHLLCIVAKRRILIHRPILPSQTLTEVKFSLEETLTFTSRGPFLESPGNFSGSKSNIQIEIQRIRAQVLTSKLLHFVSLNDSFIMLHAKLLKPRSLI